MFDEVIIGRGPSAYGALLGALQNGRRPAILAPTRAWQGETVDPGSGGKSSLARKSRFGSTEMYRYPQAAGIDFQIDGPVPISGFPGGLSTVWGSNIQVFSGEDLKAWGSSAPAMKDAYAAILRTIPHQGASDALDRRSPWPAPFPGAQPLSKRVRRALDKADGQPSRSLLVGLGRNATVPLDQGCIACGKCLDGCPEGVIFDAGPAIARLVQQHGLTEIDAIATHLREQDGHVLIDAIANRDQQPQQIHAKRVFLAAGSIASTVLLQRSQLLQGTARLDDTQVFYVPMLPTHAPDREGTTYSLAQMFATNPTPNRGVQFHLSIYESDASFKQRAEGIIGPFANVIPRRAYQQVMAAIGFIPTTESGHIEIHKPCASTDPVTVKTVANPDSTAYVKRALRAASPGLSNLGFHLITPLAQVPNVGASYHVGHLTVTGQPGTDTDTGRVLGTSAVHVVDGAALPAVPTGPVTLTMMANAHRIATVVGAPA